MQTSVSENSSASLIDINVKTFSELQEAGISLDQLFLLEKISQGIDIGQSSKIKALTQTLVRKGLLSEEGEIANRGKAMLISLREGASVKQAKESYRIKVETAFDRWWKVYPSTDCWEHKGRKFQGSRGFKTGKESCKEKFDKILNEGDHTAEDLIRALEYEIALKKEVSLQTGENKMRYMQNTLSYLNQRTFENFIEISKTSTPRSGSADTVDI